MKKIQLLVLLLCISAFNLVAQDLKIAKLRNGLSVYIWEDSTATKTFGQVVVKAGSIDDPEEYTGMAHYLEHLMFKGTDRISSLNWEREEPLYKQIIAKYDEMADEADPAKKKEINKEINKLTIEASKYGKSNEFPALIESFGGFGLNAGTSYDYTKYHNGFPTSELEKWLEIYSSRLINPVFRAFQAELETVYEEYNMYNDDPGQAIRNFIFDNIYKGTPYARQIIGKGEHLKNPRLSKVIEFYDKWYVPGNMALVLVGNIKSEEVLPLINRKFARLQAKPLPERNTLTRELPKGKVKASAKIGRMPTSLLVYEGITYSDADYIALEICTKILYNRTGSGLLNKLSVDGEVLHASANFMPAYHTGKILIDAVPSYDFGQRRFASHASMEKLLLSSINKLKEGNIEEWLVGSVKTEMCKNYDLSMESDVAKAELISRLFIYDQDIESIVDYKSKVLSISLEDIKRVAKQYFADDFWSLSIEQGKPKSGEKMTKPEVDQIESPDGRSIYAEWFENIPSKEAIVELPDINKVKTAKINDLSKLFYTNNSKNEIFTLTIKYGVGNSEIPKLEMATSLMNNAGIMAQLKPHEFKEELSKYGASVSYVSDDSYLYITMTGIDLYLKEACNLLTRQILMPDLDEKQLNNLRGSVLQGRMIEKKDSKTIGNALFQYVKYKDKSEYLDRMTSDDVKKTTISNLVGEFQKATNYAAEIFYTGTLSFDDSYEILSKNLPLKEGEVRSNSPAIQDRLSYTQNTIYFTPNSEAEQSQIYFYIEGKPYKLDDDINIISFNQYFTSGFGSVILNEIREKKSLAYGVHGAIVTPSVQDKNYHFSGFMSTQGDKTLEAVELFIKLMNELPEYEGRVDAVKNYLIEMFNMNKPSFRSEAMIFEQWKRLGYTDAPAKSGIPKIKELTFEKIKEVHSNNIKGKPVVIAISGNPKDVDLKALEKFGKVERISADRLFSKD